MSHVSAMGFTGAYLDSVTGCYPLGNGYRLYLLALFRFNAADSFSPFGEGGPNPYAYCSADPVNHADPTGHYNIWEASTFPELRSWLSNQERLNRALSEAESDASIGAANSAAASDTTRASTSTDAAGTSRKRKLSDTSGAGDPKRTRPVQSATTSSAPDQMSLRTKNLTGRTLREWRLRRWSEKFSARATTELSGVSADWGILLDEVHDFRNQLEHEFAVMPMVPDRMVNVADELEGLFASGEALAERLGDAETLIPAEERLGFGKMFHDHVESLIAVGQNLAGTLDRDFQFPLN